MISLTESGQHVTINKALSLRTKMIKIFKVTMKIKEIQKKDKDKKIEEWIDLILKAEFTFLLVDVKYPANEKTSPKHCMYVKHKSVMPDPNTNKNRYVMCINSIKEDDEPAHDLTKNGTKFYSVYCIAEEPNQKDIMKSLGRELRQEAI